MERDIALVIDCGSTKIAAFAIDARGKILASASVPNSTSAQPGHPGWIIWDMDSLWKKICRVCKVTLRRVPQRRLRAVIPVTWGTDGTFVERSGGILYPVISWQCPRTNESAREILKMKSHWDIYRITGYPVIPFNTMLRLFWLREHEPKILNRAYKWLAMAGLIGLKLTGSFSIEPTLASTGMFMNLARCDWSKEMLQLARLDKNLFPRWFLSREVIGEVLPSAAKATGIPAGTPVAAGGHDTQFAAVGAGTKPSEALISSGTWEILMTRSNRFLPRKSALERGVLWEIAAEPGKYDPQLLMMGSGVLEWVAAHFYADLSGRKGIYARMIREAEKVHPGADGVTIIPSFVRGSGPFRKWNTSGALLGLNLSTNRSHIYRAALEGLSFQLRLGLDALSLAAGLKPKAIRVVGGGSKNLLWNRIRADVTGLPIRTIEQKEATALGAAMCAFVGTGYFRSIAAARRAIAWNEETILPSKDRSIYEGLYRKFVSLPPALQTFAS